MQSNEQFQQWKKALESHQYKYSEDLYTIFREIYKNHQIPITWMPSENQLTNSNIAETILELEMENYQQLFSWAATNREKFWEYTIKKIGIKFSKKPSKILFDNKNPENPQWCKNAQLNIIDSCFLASKNKPALIIASESTEYTTKLSYEELETKVNKFASGLVKNGFKPEDRIVLYLPFCEEAIVAFLATIKAGISNVLVADSFTEEELRKRIDISKAKAIITIDEYIYNGKKIQPFQKVKNLDSITKILVKTNTETKLSEGDIVYTHIIEQGKGAFDSYTTEPDYITSILFSSGTTGIPKAIPWTQLTPIKCASDGYFHQDIKPEDNVTWTTGMGWMMAPWLIYASLINKATLCIYNGAATSKNFGKFIEKEQINILGTIPSVVRAWKKSAFHTKFDWKIKVFSSTGEPSNTEEYFYLMGLGKFEAPIIEYCGGTEIGGGYLTGSVVQPASPAYFTTPALGMDIFIHSEQEHNEVYIIPPSIGLSEQLLNKNHHDEYYKNTKKGPAGEILRKHGDAIEQLIERGNIFYKSAGRTDDAMNLGGIKISAVEIEDIINTHTAISESAAVAQSPKEGGPEELALYIVGKKELDLKELQKDLQKLISTKLNPLFRISYLKQLDQLPRTTSNKVMRKELRKEIK
jgi:acetyl-CoA synthetase